MTELAERYSAIDAAVAGLETVRQRHAGTEAAVHVVTLQAIRMLRDHGLSSQEIASVIGIRTSAVNRHIRAGLNAGIDSAEVRDHVDQAWCSGWRRRTAREVLASKEYGSWRREKELITGAVHGAKPGESWPYHLSAYRFPGSNRATRDSFAMVLGQSAWMAASIRRDGGQETCTLWGLLEELREAQSIQRFDEAMQAIQVIADQEGCWIEFVDPEQSEPDLFMEPYRGRRE